MLFAFESEDELVDWWQLLELVDFDRVAGGIVQASRSELTRRERLLLVLSEERKSLVAEVSLSLSILLLLAPHVIIDSLTEGILGGELWRTPIQ